MACNLTKYKKNDTKQRLFLCKAIHKSQQKWYSTRNDVSIKENGIPAHLIKWSDRRLGLIGAWRKTFSQPSQKWCYSKSIKGSHHYMTDWEDKNILGWIGLCGDWHWNLKREIIKFSPLMRIALHNLEWTFFQNFHGTSLRNHNF